MTANGDNSKKSANADRCRALGCQRKTKDKSGFCFQHAEMFPLMAKHARDNPRRCYVCGMEEVHHANICYGCWKEQKKENADIT